MVPLSMLCLLTIVGVSHATPVPQYLLRTVNEIALTSNEPCHLVDGVLVQSANYVNTSFTSKVPGEYYCVCNDGFEVQQGEFGANCEACPTGTYRHSNWFNTACQPVHDYHLRENCSGTEVDTHVGQKSHRIRKGGVLVATAWTSNMKACVCATGFQSEGSECSPCPVNTFKVQPGNSNCSSCNDSPCPSSEVVAICKNDTLLCEPCPLGMELKNNGSCEPCPLNHYRESLTQETCEPCGCEPQLRSQVAPCRANYSGCVPCANSSCCPSGYSSVDGLPCVPIREDPTNRRPQFSLQFVTSVTNVTSYFLQHYEHSHTLNIKDFKQQFQVCEPDQRIFWQYVYDVEPLSAYCCPDILLVTACLCAPQQCLVEGRCVACRVKENSYISHIDAAGVVVNSPSPFWTETPGLTMHLFMKLTLVPRRRATAVETTFSSSFQKCGVHTYLTSYWVPFNAVYETSNLPRNDINMRLIDSYIVDVCACGPGFQYNGSTCEQCPLNTFKNHTGDGPCQPCNIDPCHNITSRYSQCHPNGYTCEACRFADCSTPRPTYQSIDSFEPKDFFPDSRRCRHKVNCVNGKCECQCPPHQEYLLGLCRSCRTGTSKTWYGPGPCIPLIGYDAPAENFNQTSFSNLSHFAIQCGKPNCRYTCQPGFYLAKSPYNSDEFTCLDCPLRTFKTEVGDAPCSPCPADDLFCQGAYPNPNITGGVCEVVYTNYWRDGTWYSDWPRCSADSSCQVADFDYVWMLISGKDVRTWYDASTETVYLFRFTGGTTNIIYCIKKDDIESFGGNVRGFTMMSDSDTVPNRSPVSILTSANTGKGGWIASVRFESDITPTAGHYIETLRLGSLQIRDCRTLRAPTGHYLFSMDRCDFYNRYHWFRDCSKFGRQCPSGQYQSNCGTQSPGGVLDDSLTNPGICTSCAVYYKQHCDKRQAMTLIGCGGTSTGSCQLCSNFRRSDCTVDPGTDNFYVEGCVSVDSHDNICTPCNNECANGMTSTSCNTVSRGECVPCLNIDPSFQLAGDNLTLPSFGNIRTFDECKYHCENGFTGFFCETPVVTPTCHAGQFMQEAAWPENRKCVDCMNNIPSIITEYQSKIIINLIPTHGFTQVRVLEFYPLYSQHGPGMSPIQTDFLPNRVTWESNSALKITRDNFPNTDDGWPQYPKGTLGFLNVTLNSTIRHAFFASDQASAYRMSVRFSQARLFSTGLKVGFEVSPRTQVRWIDITHQTGLEWITTELPMQNFLPCQPCFATLYFSGKGVVAIEDVFLQIKKGFLETFEDSRGEVEALRLPCSTTNS